MDEYTFPGQSWGVHKVVHRFLRRAMKFQASHYGQQGGWVWWETSWESLTFLGDWLIQRIERKPRNGATSPPLEWPGHMTQSWAEWCHRKKMSWSSLAKARPKWLVAWQRVPRSQSLWCISGEWNLSHACFASSHNEDIFPIRKLQWKSSYRVSRKQQQNKTTTKKPTCVPWDCKIGMHARKYKQTNKKWFSRFNSLSPVFFFGRCMAW